MSVYELSNILKIFNIKLESTEHVLMKSLSCPEGFVQKFLYDYAELSFGFKKSSRQFVI